MITKAIVKETNKIGTNKFKVYIPLLRNANDEERDAIYDATLCYTAGIMYTLKVNDVVFVDFEDNLMEKPVILGKLYRGDTEDNSDVQLKVKTINITEKCSLPENTTISNVNLKDMVKEIEKGFSLDIDKQS